MKYCIVCPLCKEEFWIRGGYDPSVNATELDENDREWDYVCEHIKNTGEWEFADIDPSYDEYDDNVI